ncbi:MAG: helicase-associated domain-containing protein [Spirochaetaceae bacterium]|nr:helicase-associated domain-containing protein [Spirochaetaceae bacterium]
MTRNVNTNKTQQILLWREALCQLPDNHFFDLMRMYLGEIKTPYNKQKLIESLSSFLHKTEVRQRILDLLSTEDIQIIASVKFLNLPTENLLTSFFSEIMPFSVFYDLLLNLEERLLLFQYTDFHSGKRVFAINPLLEDFIEPFVDISVLLPVVLKQKPYKTNTRQLSSQLLAGMFSFLAQQPDICKQDGTLKKRTLESLSEKFPNPDSKNNLTFFQTLITALTNLALLQPNGKGLIPQYQIWLNFAKLDSALQSAYLMAAACGKDSKNAMQRKAAQALELLQSVPKEGFTLQILNRAEFIVQHKKPEQNSEVFSSSRFRSIMQAALNQGLQESEQSQNLPVANSLVQAAINLGLLQHTANTNQDQKEIPIYTSRLPEIPLEKTSFSTKGFVGIDAAFSVTIMPGLSLIELLPVVCLMNLQRFDTATTFEITKNSCNRAFALGYMPHDIIQKLQTYITYTLPQNLQVTLEDWYHSYNAVMLYKGYLLQITDGKDIVNNPVLNPYIIKTLATGIYIMNFTNDTEAEEVMIQAGFENGSQVKKLDKSPQSLCFTPLPQIFPLPRNKTMQLQEPLQQQSFCNQMEQFLEQQDFTQQQKQGLQTRIRRKIILLPQQLRADSVRHEVLEANGMDFSGKIHLVEIAISTGTLVKLSYSSPEGKNYTVVGTPISLDKKNPEIPVILQLEKDGSNKTYSLGKANTVQRIPGAIFREPK